MWNFYTNETREQNTSTLMFKIRTEVPSETTQSFNSGENKHFAVQKQRI